MVSKLNIGPSRKYGSVFIEMNDINVLCSVCYLMLPRICETLTVIEGSTRWFSKLRHSATSRKVAGSIPGGVNGIFHSASNLTENQGYPLGVKAAGLMCQVSKNSGILNLTEPSRPVQACNGMYLPYLTVIKVHGVCVMLTSLLLILIYCICKIF
jgi:hypothetical protein